VVFQPHRYTRTRDLFEQFADLLAAEACLIIAEVYAAGEAPIDGADGRSLCEAIRSRGGRNPVFMEDVRELAVRLDGVLQPGDVVLTLGAGDIGRVVRECLTFHRSMTEGAQG
jgi:UDP-N-acetylmuramate--alanine ligase